MSGSNLWGFAILRKSFATFLHSHNDFPAIGS